MSASLPVREIPEAIWGWHPGAASLGLAALQGLGEE
jgi:hypothetical protein